MMEFEIHFEYEDGSEDYIVVSGDSVEEIREKAQREVRERGGRNPWSVERPQ